MDESSNIGGIIQSKIIIAAAAAVIIAVAGIAAIAVLGNDDGQDKTFNPYDSDSVRLKILGNADGSDAIDSDDVDLINRIIEANSDEDEIKHIDWKTQYPFADADNDGDVDADDAALVQNFINKESAKMYYLNYYGNVTYVNYPVGQHIGAEYLQLQILPIIHSYSMLTAIDTTTPTMYGDSMFPGITKLESLGNWREITVETMTKLNSEGKLDTLLQWTGGQERRGLPRVLIDRDGSAEGELVMEDRPVGRSVAVDEAIRVLLPDFVVEPVRVVMMSQSAYPKLDFPDPLLPMSTIFPRRSPRTYIFPKR